MNDPNKEYLAINADPSKSTGDVQATKSRHLGESLHPETPVARRKRWLFTSLIVLMASGALALIVYLFRSQLMYNGRYVGILMAFCALACGGFLGRHLIRVLAEEDKLEEEPFNANQETVSPSESNPAGQDMNPTTPPSEVGQNIK
jgi:hypothetical protein